jgi:hypothetical protein
LGSAFNQSVEKFELAREQAADRMRRRRFRGTALTYQSGLFLLGFTAIPM